MKSVQLTATEVRILLEVEQAVQSAAAGMRDQEHKKNLVTTLILERYSIPKDSKIELDPRSGCLHYGTAQPFDTGPAPTT